MINYCYLFRDIKSANVLLSQDHSKVKLADFGALKEIGSISVVGGLKGTPHWMVYYFA